MKSVRPILFTLAFAAAVTVVAEDPSDLTNMFLGQTVKNIRVPLQRHENGRVKEIMIAEEAFVTPDGVYHAEKSFQVFFFSAEGATNGVLRTQNAEFTPNALTNATAAARGPIRLDFEPKGVSLAGVDLTWKALPKTITIHSNAVLSISRQGRSTIRGLSR